MFDSRLKRCVAALGACALLASCSGGGSSIPSGQSIANAPAIPNIPAAKKRGAAAFTIVIPKATTASKSRLAQIALRAHGARRPQYVSAATQSLVVTLTSVNGTPVPSPQAYAINVSNASCTSTCTLVVPATAGNDVFALATYDAAQSSPNPTSPTGNLLSKQTTTVTIVANTTNAVNVPVTLDAVVASITLSFSGGYYWYGSQTVPVSIQPRDADGDLIVGPGALLDGNGSPLTVTLANADTSGVTTLSGTTFTGTALSSASLAYTGGPLAGGAAITASAPGITGSTSTFAPHLKSGTLFMGTSQGVAIYDTTVSPVALVTTIASSFYYCYGVALDANGKLYVSSAGASTVSEFAAGATTSSTTLQIPGIPQHLAVDTSGRLFVTESGVYTPANNLPLYFDPGSSTAHAIGGGSSLTSGSDGAAVDPSTHILLITEGYNVYAYTNGLNSAPTTVYQFGGSNGPGSISFRPDGSLLVVTGSLPGAIYSISSPLSTPGTPTVVASNLSLPNGAAVDSSGNTFIATNSNGSNDGILAKVPVGTTTVNTVVTFAQLQNGYQVVVVQ